MQKLQAALTETGDLVYLLFHLPATEIKRDRNITNTHQANAPVQQLLRHPSVDFSWHQLQPGVHEG